MRKHLQIALMASPVIATFLSFTTPQLQAQAGFGTAASITTAVDDSGRKIYVNDDGAVNSKKGIDSGVTNQRSFLLEPQRSPVEAGSKRQDRGCTFRGC